MLLAGIAALFLHAFKVAKFEMGPAACLDGRDLWFEVKTECGVELLFSHLKKLGASDPHLGRK